MNRFISLRQGALSACALLVLTACSVTDQNAYQQMSAEDAFSYDTELVSSLNTDYELIRQVSSQISHSNIYDDSLQPVNKKSKCILPFIVSNSGSDTSFYWDGACRGGFASGVGRAVRVDGNVKSAEYLFEFDPKHPERLVAYLSYDLRNSMAEAGYSIIELKDGRLDGMSMTMGYSPEKWRDGEFEFTYRFEDTGNLRSYTRVHDLLNLESSYILAFPNYSEELRRAEHNVMTTVDSAYRLLEGSKAVGYSFISVKDGGLVMHDTATDDEVRVTGSLPALAKRSSELEAEVRDRLDRYDPLLDKGLAAVEKYNRTKCAKHRPLFKGDESSAVCSFLDELSVNHDLLLDAKERRSAALETYLLERSQRLDRLERNIRDVRRNLHN